MVTLGKIKEIKDLREAWPNEALDFTPWLAKNISILGEAVGIDISVQERESPVGNFSADIFATDSDNGRKIIIENQLEDTDHDHLGKLITYALLLLFKSGINLLTRFGKTNPINFDKNLNSISGSLSNKKAA